MSDEILGKDFDEYLIPFGATRVQVKDEDDNPRWRKVDEIRDTDRIQLNPSTQKPYTMSNSPGRRKKTPEQISDEEGRRRIGRKRQSLRQDTIRAIARKDPESSDVLQEVMVAISEEAAALKFEREEADRKGDKGVVQISLKRVQALRAIGDTWLKRKELVSSGEIDIEGPEFEKLLTFIFETFGTALEKSGVRGELGEAIFSNLAKLLGEKTWKTEARKRMKK